MENTPLPTTTDEMVTFKRSHFYAIMVVFSFAVGILVGYMAWGRGTPAQQVAVVQAQQAQVPTAQAAEPSFTRYDIPTEGYPSLGPEDAKIVLVEFSDYQ
jgi:anti-sigma-K factor RskA